LCAPDDAAALRLQVVNGNISDATAAAHLIPDEARAAAAQRDWDLFIEARLEAMQEVERTFVNEILARNPNLLSGGPSDHGPLFG
jgi:hypothetical protein